MSNKTFRNKPTRFELSPEEKKLRQRFLYATLVTCISAAMIFGVMHVVKLGSNRIADMRSKAGYDLKDESKHIRAAGEDIETHRIHEETKNATFVYAVAEIHSLITEQQWHELDQELNIPAGEFVMGSDAPRTDDVNRPEHKVELPSFLIDKYPVTNIEYAKFVADTKHRPPLDWVLGKIPDRKYLHPVVMVSWYDAKAYCEYKNQYLPSEAQWEKAARGPNANRWPWGNKMDPTRLNTYYTVGSTTEVTRYERGISGYGVFDMSGNVSEWTATEFGPYAGSTASAMVFKPKIMKAAKKDSTDSMMKIGDLEVVEGSVYKVRRGGSWKSDPFATSAYHRNYSSPHYASDFFGFRCARDG